MKYIIILILALFFCESKAENTQAALLLDLKQAKSSYNSAREKVTNNKKLLDNNAISLDAYNNSKSMMLSAEIKYQKLLLKLMADQSYILVQKAIKYQAESGERRVKVLLKSTMDNNKEYLKMFKDHFDVFSPEMYTNKIYNIFVSLTSIKDNTIIGTPYEVHVPEIESGKAVEADFSLLKDAESVVVTLNYNGKKDTKNIFLEKDASTNKVDVVSQQFAQEVYYGSKATYNLTLERFSNSDDIYRLIVVGLPKEISYDFVSPDSRAQISQIKFNQGENIIKLNLNTYIPEQGDATIQVDKSIEMYMVVLSKSEYAKIKGDNQITLNDIEKVKGGRVKLELIPRGKGLINLFTSNLYHEIEEGEDLEFKIEIKNDGTRELNNIRIKINNPLNWKSEITPENLSKLDIGENKMVKIKVKPPKDVSIGEQELKIWAESFAKNTKISSDDKLIRVKVFAEKSVLGSIILILLLLGVVSGIVYYGIKLSKR